MSLPEVNEDVMSTINREFKVNGNDYLLKIVRDMADSQPKLLRTIRNLSNARAELMEHLTETQKVEYGAFSLGLAVLTWKMLETQAEVTEMEENWG